MKSITLTTLFDKEKHSLESQLSGLEMPQNADKVQNIISGFLNMLLDDQGEYRQNLTKSEDYILQAGIALIGSKEEQSNILLTDLLNTNEEQPEGELKSALRQHVNQPKTDVFHAIIGAGGGSLVGHLFASGWGCVIGAIAGVAIAGYIDNTDFLKRYPSEPCETRPDHILSDDKGCNTIDISQICNIVRTICANIDSLIAIYRSQINALAMSYKNQPKPTLENDFGDILESIQSLYGASLSPSVSEEKRFKKIEQRLEQVSEVLESYGLDFITYSENNSSFFEIQSSSKVEEPTLVYPAIIKNGELIRRGKVFVKE